MEQGLGSSQRHPDLPSDFEQKFIEKGGVKYPCHPDNPKKCSKFPVGFDACLSCGEQHSFKECPTNRTHNGRDTFHYELHCHKPWTWFRWQLRKSTTNASPSNYRGGGRGRGREATSPAWMTRQNSSSNTYGPSNTGSVNDGDEYSRADKRTRHQFVISVRCCNVHNSNLRRMPITSSNDLPHVSFPIGSKADEASITCLYDTGGALNTGNLALHMHIRKTVPTAVYEFEEFDGSKPFDPIKLCGALLDPSDYDSSKHGILSAVIRYHTPYSTIEGKKVFLCFALGADMSVDTIMGIPFIHELSMELRLRPKQQFLAHEIKTSFPVMYKETVLTQFDSSKDSSDSPVSSVDPPGSMGDPLRSFLQSVASAPPAN